MKTNSKAFRRACAAASKFEPDLSDVDDFCRSIAEFGEFPKVSLFEASVICAIVWSPGFQHPMIEGDARRQIACDIEDALLALPIVSKGQKAGLRKDIEVLQSLIDRLRRMKPWPGYMLYLSAWLSQFAPNGSDLGDFFTLAPSVPLKKQKV